MNFRYLFILIFVLDISTGYTQEYKLEHAEIPEKINSTIIHKVFSDKLGNLFLAGEIGVFKWDGQNIEEISRLENYPDYSAFNIWEDNIGRIWFNTFSENIVCYSNGLLSKNVVDSHLKGFRIDASTIDINNNYWFGDRFGRVIKIDASGRQTINNLPSRERIHKIHRIEKLADGNVIAALTFGSFYLINSKCEIIRKLNWRHNYNWGPANFFNLKNGNILFSNDTGLFQYNKNLILESFIPYGSNFKGYISDIREDEGGNLWIGSKNGLYFLGKGDFKSKNLKCVNSLISVTSISTGIEGVVWVATNGNGLMKITLNNHFLSQYRSLKRDLMMQINPASKYENRITSAVYDSVSKILWWAGNHRIGKIENNREYVFFRGKLLFLEPKDIVLDKTGRMWIGGNGLHTFDLKTGKVTLIKELENVKIQDLEFINGFLYVGTRNKGIYVIKNFRIKNIINTNNFLLSNNCKRIIHNDSQIYFRIDNRIFKYSFEGSKIIKVSVIDYNFKNIEINRVIEERLNFKCFFGDSFILVAKKIQYNPIQVHLSPKGGAFNVKGDKKKFRYNIGEITLSFCSSTFDKQDVVLYRYKLILDNVSKGWSITNRNSLVLASLTPGVYRFIIEKSFDKFNWGQGQTVDFQITPPFWKTLWFRISLGLLLFLLILAMYKNNVRNEKAKTLSIEMKLMALQSQMNPHFIFNSLTSIQKLILQNSKENSLNYLSKFVNLMRKCFEYSNQGFISVCDEIKFIKNYIEMEELRFKNKFECEIIVKDSIDEKDKIPPMIIQPILENAIKHSFKNNEIPGNIKLIFDRNDNTLVVSIIDNGTGFRLTNEKVGTSSIYRIKDRIDLLKKAQKNPNLAITVNSESHFGCVVKLVLPLNKS